ncbi:MAG TPA: wax ester/triacylglycerol synthase family O-acyltransferase [Acidimicrobiales bacterium]|nr:wax ester/triacylglycerol synthase family O-acyltransferase [Acidimicrobiales bacterium]
MPVNDSMFLLAERREQPMHVGGLQLFHFPPGADERWMADLYESITHCDPGQISPVFRRRPHRPATSLGAWSWEDDPDVDLEHHLRHSALPRPGRVRELLALVSRLHGTLLDRHRPLWEAHLIEGLEGNRFAVYSKIHHSMMDGVSALRLLAQSLSTDPDARDLPMPFAVQPHRRSSSSKESQSGLAALLDIPVSALKTTYEVAALGPIVGRAALKAFFDQNSHLPALGPRTILNQPITGARRFAAQSWPIERVRGVAAASGTTINDVLLAMCSGALRAYLSELEALPDEPLVAMTPVSLRQAGMDVGGNAVGAMLCNLATDLVDPAARLAAVHESMEAGKATLRGMTPTQATVASAIAMSPMLLGQVPGLRRVASPGYNVVISNIPGPKEALYWNGAELEGVYPMSIPTDGQALNITVTSYNGNLEFGLTGCRRTVPHLQRLLTQLEDSLAALEKAVVAE